MEKLAEKILFGIIVEIIIGNLFVINFELKEIIGILSK